MKVGKVGGMPIKNFLKAVALSNLSQLDNVKNDVGSGGVLIVKLTELAVKSLDDVVRGVNELIDFADSIGGDIARLGEERIVICPPNVKIWRWGMPAPNGTFLMAMPLSSLSELEIVKSTVKGGNVVILRLTPIAGKSIEDAKRAITELRKFAESIKGEIVRLGEERLIVCPSNFKVVHSGKRVNYNSKTQKPRSKLIMRDAVNTHVHA